jgi:hypothetical protein
MAKVRALTKKARHHGLADLRTFAPCRESWTQVIPVGAGPCQDLGDLEFGTVFASGAHVEIGVGVKARAEPDRVAAGGP